jgi:hypothetical protein
VLDTGACDGEAGESGSGMCQSQKGCATKAAKLKGKADALLREADALLGEAEALESAEAGKQKPTVSN